MRFRALSFSLAALMASAAVLPASASRTRHSYRHEAASDSRYEEYGHGRHFRHWGRHRGRSRTERRADADDFGGDVDVVLSRRDRARRAERIRQAQAHLAALEQRVGAKERARKKALTALKKAYARRHPAAGKSQKLRG